MEGEEEEEDGYIYRRMRWERDNRGRWRRSTLITNSDLSELHDEV